MLTAGSSLRADRLDERGSPTFEFNDAAMADRPTENQSIVDSERVSFSPCRKSNSFCDRAKILGRAANQGYQAN